MILSSRSLSPETWFASAPFPVMEKYARSLHSRKVNWAMETMSYKLHLAVMKFDEGGSQHFGFEFVPD